MDRRDFIRISAGTVAGALIGCGDSSSGTDGGRRERDASSTDGGVSDGGVSDGGTSVMDAGTIPPRPSDTTQFLTWDGGSGPNRIYWNQHLKLKWRTPDTGDWIDANGDRNGAVPFVTAMVDSAGPVQFEVTSLVENWVSSGMNRGFYLQRDIAFRFEFAGRLSENGPSLEITTSEGTFAPRCLANT